jgi:ribonuclease HII
MKQPHTKFEQELWNQNLIVCGIDEVGRGCIAGPVVAAAVSFPKEHKIHEKIRDSKKVTPKMRAELFDFILDECDDFGIGLVPAETIDEIGISPATKRAMALAIDGMTKKPDQILIDAVVLDEVTIAQKSIIKGDENIYSIAAASIVAKVFRDSVVSGFDNIYPEYGFSSHKGYGTKIHYEALKKSGLTSEHRRTFLKNF